MSFYMTLTAEEKGRIHPWTRAKCVMMSGDSPVFGTRSSHHSHTDYDLPDEAQPGHITPIVPITTIGALSHNEHIDSESVKTEEMEREREKLMSMPEKNIVSSESSPKFEQNGASNSNKMISKTYLEHEDDDDDDACIKCIYIAQQCCECVII